MNDNVRPKHRELFEQTYVEIQKDFIKRLMQAKLPNLYVETILGRMLALRAAVIGEDVGPVVDRCSLIALEYVPIARERLQQVLGSEKLETVKAALKDAEKETKH